jgi:hypothetical protein
MRTGSIGIAVVTALLGGCVGESGERAPADQQLEGEVEIASAVFSGTVTNEQGVPQAGVTVVINDISRITDSAGKYFASVTSVTTGYNLSLSKTGLAPGAEFYTSGKTSLVHVLKTGYVATVNPVEGGTVRSPSGVTITLPANALVTASGGAPTGMVQITIASYEPLQMPGDFTAVNAAGQQVALESVGAVFVGAVDAAGQALDLGNGKTSQAFIPVPAAVGAMPPCVAEGTCRLAMWKFNPNTGKWVENAGAGMQPGSSGTSFAMRGGAGLSAQAIPVSASGLGMWNADIEKKTPACTIIELVNFPTACYGAGNKVTLNLKLPNATGTLISRVDTLSSVTPFVVLYNIRSNVVQEVGLTFPADAPSATCGKRLTIASSPGPVASFPVYSSSGGVTRFNSGAPWGGAGFPVDSTSAFIDFEDVALGTHPCKSHVWFQLP